MGCTRDEQLYAFSLVNKIKTEDDLKHLFNIVIKKKRRARVHETEKKITRPSDILKVFAAPLV